MNDLIIGMAHGYTWENLYPFVVSLRRTGYDGRCVLLGNAEIPAKYNVEVIDPGPMERHCIVERFRIIPKHITDDLRYVIACDTSDIVFNRNPIKWIEKNLGDHVLCVASECVRYKDSPGNSKNMIEAFPQCYQDMKEREVLNAGWISGDPLAVKQTMNMVHFGCLSDRRSGVTGKTWDDMLPDQSVLNYLLSASPHTRITKPEDRFVYEYSYGDLDPDEFAVVHQYTWRWREKYCERFRP